MIRQECCEWHVATEKTIHGFSWIQLRVFAMKAELFYCFKKILFLKKIAELKKRIRSVVYQQRSYRTSLFI